ncbi:helix-turn-helix transcriptional regulator [Olivibacter sp. SDN3]|uniref:helix-turn-helix domain-containing protein n=1 Tax=Olivibacter sp. SDN3 TaxID=2764720 RepID=UPI0016514149|nr:helix-turn-helix transcriptional regulator [Olivibacter sp. SDN3]QNL48143.1 helix-turn-helix transcriptional regulator [Olivibacter sp. SDN3]
MTELKIMKILREANGYSQEYTASYLKISQNTYSKIENGQIRLTIDRMKKLAQLYNVPANVFLSEDLPVVNFNTGSHSRTIISTQEYNESEHKTVIKLYERFIKEKDEQIEALKKQNEKLSKENERLLSHLIDDKTT